MKKIFIIGTLLLCGLYSLATTPVQGSWKSGNVVYTFDQDTLYIDEVGNEGDVYTLSYKDDSIVATNIWGDKLTFMVNKINDRKIKLIFEDISFFLNKTDNYDVENMTFIK